MLDTVHEIIISLKLNITNIMNGVRLMQLSIF